MAGAGRPRPSAPRRGPPPPPPRPPSSPSWHPPPRPPPPAALRASLLPVLAPVADAAAARPARRLRSGCRAPAVRERNGADDDRQPLGCRQRGARATAHLVPPARPSRDDVEALVRDRG